MSTRTTVTVDLPVDIRREGSLVVITSPACHALHIIGRNAVEALALVPEAVTRLARITPYADRPAETSSDALPKFSRASHSS